MPLIDGRYEVLSEQPLGGGCTQFMATAPDGTPLRIEWFELPHEREAAFERHRRLLKQLMKEGRAALHDVVSRPGARYVAWLTPPEGAREARDQSLEGLLSAQGYERGSALILRANGRSPQSGRTGTPLLYSLTFGESLLPAVVAPLPMSEEPKQPLRPATRSPLKQLRELSAESLSWGATASLLLVALLFISLGISARTTNALIIVPDVTGQPAQTAADTLTSLKLRVVPVAFASDEALGTVLSLEPAAGSELRPGRNVQLNYAVPTGQLATTVVPSVVGSKEPEAEAALVDGGLKAGSGARVHSPTEPGTVLAQSVDAGERTSGQGHVNLLISMGPAPELTFVPLLVGLPVAEARSLARVAGIDDSRVIVDEISSARGARGEVLSQSLAPHVPVPTEGAVLRLVVQGSAAVPAQGGAPDLVGLPLSEAQRVADAYDVTVRRLATPGLPEGVVSQTPPPGELTEGRQLELVVNAHPVRLTTSGIRAYVSEPRLRAVAYAWSIQPGIRAQRAEVWARDIEGASELVEIVTVSGGEILRGSWFTARPGPITFELLLAGVPYGQPLLVP